MYKKSNIMFNSYTLFRISLAKIAQAGLLLLASHRLIGTCDRSAAGAHHRIYRPLE